MSKQVSFSDPFVAARIEKVSVAGSEIEKIGVVIPDDTGADHCVGVLSKEYNLVQNSTARDVALDVMSRTEYRWKEMKTIWNGKQLIQSYVTEDSITKISGSNDHPLHAGVMIRNSYDGTGKFGFEFFAFNLVCHNQYISRNRFGYFAFRHTDKGFDLDDAITNVQKGSERLLAIAPKISELRQQELQSSNIIAAKQNTMIPQSKWGDVIDQLAKEEGTVFGLFQAMTFIATHQLVGYTAITIGDSITSHILGKDQ